MASMAEKYGGAEGGFAAALQAFSEQTMATAETIFANTVLEMSTRIVLKSPVGDPSRWKSPPPAGDGYVGGRFRANWQFQNGAPAAGVIDAVDPDGSRSISAARTGSLTLKLGDTAYLVNNLPYSIPLEYGHSSQAPVGMVRTTLDEFQSVVRQIASQSRAD